MSAEVEARYVRCLSAESALAELLRDVACRKATGTATLVLTLNQGGVTSAHYGVQENKPKKP